MEEQLIKKKNSLEIAEMVAIVGSFGGSIAAFCFNNTLFASVPISACLALNFVNRKNLRQDTVLFQETTLFQVDRQINNSQEIIERSLEDLKNDNEKLSGNIIQNKQDSENYCLELKKKQDVATEIIERLREISLASQAINDNPRNAESYCQRGLNYEQLGYKRGAIYDYSKAIEISPSCARAFYQRGLVHIELGERKAALDDLRRAAKFYFDNGDLVEYQKARDLSQELYEFADDSKDEDKNEEAVVLKGFMS
jgi:tetratricopeptide (TPR) repeat protein